MGACFYWECLLSGSPRSGIAGGGAAAAAGRRTEDGGRARTLRCAPETGDEGRGMGADVPGGGCLLRLGAGAGRGRFAAGA